MGSISVGKYAILTKPGSLYKSASAPLLLELKSGIKIFNIYNKNTSIGKMQRASQHMPEVRRWKKKSQYSAIAPLSSNH